MDPSEEKIVPIPESTEEGSAALPPPSRKIWLPFHFALAALVVVAVFLFSGGGSMRDPDIWWHLNNAEQIVHGHMPHVDVYSFTAKGSPWMDHEWLAEVPYYLAFRTFGLRGLYATFLLLAVLIELGILYRCYKLTGDIKNSFVVAIFCVLLIVVSFGPRMLLFGWIYMLVLLVAMDRFREGSARAIWVLPPLFLLWVNTHGSWLIGLAVFGLIAASGLISFDLGQVLAEKWTRPQFKSLIIVSVLSCAALFVNPYGYKLVTYPYDMAFHQTLNVAHVEEWQSVNFHDGRGKVMLILLGALLACAWFSKRRWRLEEAALVCLALYSGLTYVRFVFLMALLISPILAARLKLFPPYNAKIDKPWLNLAVALIVCGIIVYRFPTESKIQETVADSYPVKSVQYLREHNVKDNVLNYFLWGGYLERYYPEMPVFIDSRVDIFEYNGTLKDYLDIIGLKDSLALLDKHKIEYAFLTPSDPFAYFLRNTPSWEVVYEDKISILLKRRVPLQAK
jgi:hypothetical protein